MDELDQMVLASIYPPVEAFVQLHLTVTGEWIAHCRIRHESWGWSEATVDHYERLGLPELMDVLEGMESHPEAR